LVGLEDGGELLFSSILVSFGLCEMMKRNDRQMTFPLSFSPLFHSLLHIGVSFIISGAPHLFTIPSGNHAIHKQQKKSN